MRTNGQNESRLLPHDLPNACSCSYMSASRLDVAVRDHAYQPLSSARAARCPHGIRRGCRTAEARITPCAARLRFVLQDRQSDPRMPTRSRKVPILRDHAGPCVRRSQPVAASCVVDALGDERARPGPRCVSASWLKVPVALVWPGQISTSARRERPSHDPGAVLLWHGSGPPRRPSPN